MGKGVSILSLWEGDEWGGLTCSTLYLFFIGGQSYYSLFFVHYEAGRVAIYPPLMLWKGVIATFLLWFIGSVIFVRYGEGWLQCSCYQGGWLQSSLCSKGGGGVLQSSV